jgi:hypothetical protein
MSARNAFVQNSKAFARPSTATLRLSVFNMTEIGWEIVGKDDQELPLGKTIGDALRDLIRKRWKNNAAKVIERRWDLDPKTAKNLTAGHCSERSLTKAAKAERWALWMALGEELFEETYDQHLNSIIEETARAKDRMERHRASVRHLEARASELVDLGRGLGA